MKNLIAQLKNLGVFITGVLMTLDDSSKLNMVGCTFIILSGLFYIGDVIDNKLK